jgi:hypothetical protein
VKHHAIRTGAVYLCRFNGHSPSDERFELARPIDGTTLWTGPRAQQDLFDRAPQALRPSRSQLIGILCLREPLHVRAAGLDDAPVVRNLTARAARLLAVRHGITDTATEVTVRLTDGQHTVLVGILQPGDFVRAWNLDGSGATGPAGAEPRPYIEESP